MATMKSLLSIKYAAAMLGVHEQTLREWEDKGKIVAIRTKGGHRRYALSEIEALMAKKPDEDFQVIVISDELREAVSDEILSREIAGLAAAFKQSRLNGSR